MPIPVRCSCGKQYRVKDELAGKVVTCAGCKAKLKVPQQSAITSSPAVRSEKRTKPPTRLVVIAFLALAVASGVAIGAYLLFFRDSQGDRPIAKGAAPTPTDDNENKPHLLELAKPKGRAPLCTIKVPSGEILDVAVNWRTQTAYRVITADSTNNVMVWDDSGKQLGVFKGHSSAKQITAISLAPDGSLVATAALISKDGEPAAEIMVWETDSTYVVREITTYLAHLRSKPLPPVTALCLNARAKYQGLLSEQPLQAAHRWMIAGIEGGMWIWDVGTGKEVSGFTMSETARVNHIAMGQPAIVAGREDNLAILWDLRGLSQQLFVIGTSVKNLKREDGFTLFQSHKAPIRRTAAMGEKGAATADQSGRAVVWDAAGHIRYDLPDAGPFVTASIDVITIAQPGADGQIVLKRWSDRQRELLHTVDDIYHQDADLIVASRDGRRLATRSSGGKNEIHFWNTEPSPKKENPTKGP